MSGANLPEGWVDAPLGEYLYLKNGYAFKSTSYVAKSDETVPVIRISDINGKVASDETAIHVKKVDVIDGFEIKNGDLLIAMSGATTGKVGVYRGSEPAYQNQRVGNLKLHSEVFGSPKYKNHLIASLTPDILKIAYGGAQPNISGKAIEELLIAIPPLAEQQQIAQKLDALLAQVDTLKARLDAIPNILKRFRQSVLAAAVSGRLTEEWRRKMKVKLTVEKYKTAILIDKFKPKYESSSSPIETSCGWLKLSLGQLLTVSSGDGLTSKEMKEGNIPVYGGNGINGYHNAANFTERKIVIGRVGFYCGSVHFTEKMSWVTDNALVVNFPESLVDIKFVYTLLRATNLREDSASTAQPVISGSKIYPIELMLPPLEEQTEIVHRVEQLFTYADQIEQRVKDAQSRVNHLTQSILAKAFRGELTAEWRAQNPELISGENSAAALFERIKAERNNPLPASPLKRGRGKRLTPP